MSNPNPPHEGGGIPKGKVSVMYIPDITLELDFILENLAPHALFPLKELGAVPRRGKPPATRNMKFHESCNYNSRFCQPWNP